MSPSTDEASSSENLVQCYNKGCGKKFDPKNNTPDACSYHPGPPYFHDAYKIWNCCNKKSTDFGTWLNYPGCTRGKHSAEKPADCQKVIPDQTIRPEKEDEVIVWKGLNKPAERLAEEHRFEVELEMEVTSKAKEAIEKWRESSEGNCNFGKTLQIGAPCRNAGCEMRFAGSDSENDNCIHHPGQAIFHEGMKYWSCCNKKTSNFNAFLDQKGCSKGEHNWSKEEKVDKLKEDWFSSNGMVTVNVYCKGALPEETSVHTDGQLLRVSLKHGFGTKETNLIYDLFGRIVPEKSKVIVGERKLEVVLKQRDPEGWPRLKYDQELDAKPAM